MYNSCQTAGGAWSWQPARLRIETLYRKSDRQGISLTDFCESLVITCPNYPHCLSLLSALSAPEAAE